LSRYLVAFLGIAVIVLGSMTTSAKNDQRELQKATLAGGCFWGVEELIRKLPGVAGVQVGYTGGSVRNATYEHHEGHAEAVEITFDPKKISYEDILLFFFKLHDPTTLNRQGNDLGTSYRSAIFYHDEAQRETAERVKTRVDKSGAWKRPVVTEIVPAKEFWTAEEYHQTPATTYETSNSETGSRLRERCSDLVPSAIGTDHGHIRLWYTAVVPSASIRPIAGRCGRDANHEMQLHLAVRMTLVSARAVPEVQWRFEGLPRQSRLSSSASPSPIRFSTA